MNSQLSCRKGWQLVCWIGGPAAALTWLKNNGDSTAWVSSRRFRSFHAGSMLWKNRGAVPGGASLGYHPNPKPSPLTVEAPSGDFSDWATSECFVSRIRVEGRSGSPE